MVILRVCEGFIGNPKGKRVLLLLFFKFVVLLGFRDFSRMATDVCSHGGLSLFLDIRVKSEPPISKFSETLNFKRENFDFFNKSFYNLN